VFLAIVCSLLSGLRVREDSGPREAHALWSRAATAFQSGDLEEAARLYRQAERADGRVPHHAPVRRLDDPTAGKGAWR
jgi:hypothetical protein